MNNKSTLLTIIAIIAILGIGVIALASRDDSPEASNNNAKDQSSQTTQKVEDTKPTTQADIVGVASNTASLSTLVTAVKAADLVATLQSTGPFTVFAPTNDAFSALPTGTLESLLLPENKEKLKAVLTYHVVSGKVMAADLKDGQQITTVQGGMLTVKIMDSKVYLTDATGAQAMVAQADVAAANGVVHVIDKVVLPQ